ncbi:hybrid sensor histidine kinase/response regulator [Parvularcula marina]|nr:hybrid sensor histidine kinase/response regulator [Parvularcula marina]
MSQQRSKVLLVDDEPRLLSALRRRLASDFDILTAESGPLALDILATDEEVGIVVADMQMPEMNGIELLTRLREEYPQIRRIMLTGNSDQETAIAAINEGAVMRFLRKPCDADELRKILNQGFEELKFMSQGSIEGQKEDTTEADHASTRRAFINLLNAELSTPVSDLVRAVTELSDADDAFDPLSTLTRVRDRGEYMLMLVGRLIEFARLPHLSEKDDTSPHCEIVSIVADEVEQLRGLANEKKVTLSLDARRRKAAALAKGQEVRLALRELIENAIKFSHRGEHVSVLLHVEQDEVRIMVADSGRGLTESVAHVANSPLYVDKDGHAKLHEGMGFGLALVSTIAKLNHAKFHIAPREGGGTSAAIGFRRPVTTQATNLG